MKRYLPVVLSLLLVAALAVPAAAGPFSDVPENHWAYEAVKQLAAYGLVIGFPDGEYKGNEPMTRYQLAMVVARMLVSLDAQIKAEVEAAKTVIPPAVPAEVPEAVIEKVVEKTIVEKLDTEQIEALDAKLDEKVNELIAMIDALRAEFVTELDILNARTNCLDGELQLAMEKISALEEDVAALDAKVAGVDAALGEGLAAVDQRVSNVEAGLDAKITGVETSVDAKLAGLEADLDAKVAGVGAASSEGLAALDDKIAGVDAAFGDYLADHEKVKITGSSEVKFEDVDLRGDFGLVWDADDEEYVGEHAWVDPSDIFEDDEADNHEDGRYAPGTDFKHELKLTLTAYPADGVYVKAGLKTVTNLFTGSLTGNLDVSSLSLEVKTDGILKRLYAGNLTLPAGTFTPYTFWGDAILKSNGASKYKGAIAELGYDRYSGTLLFTRINAAKDPVEESDASGHWRIVGIDVPDTSTPPDDFDAEDPTTWHLLTDYEKYVVWERSTPAVEAADGAYAKYAFAGEGKVAVLDNLNLGVAYVRAWEDYHSLMIAEEDQKPYVDQVISLAGDFTFGEGFTVDGEYAKWSRIDKVNVPTTEGEGTAARLNLTGVVGPATVKGEYVRVEKGYKPEFVFLYDAALDKGLKTNVKTIGASAEVVLIENLTLSGGYKITGSAGWDTKKHAIADVGAKYELAIGDLTLTPSLDLKHTRYIKDAKYTAEEAVLQTTAGIAAEFAPIEASFKHIDARIKGDKFAPYFKRNTLELSADYDISEAFNVYGGYTWDKREYVDAERRGSEADENLDTDNHDSEFNIGAKAGFAVYEGINLSATYDYAVANDHIETAWKPYTKSILTAGVDAQVTPKSNISGKAEYHKLDRFYDRVQYEYAPVTNIIGEVKYAYDITTNTALNLGYKVIKSDVETYTNYSYLARIITGSLKVTF